MQNLDAELKTDNGLRQHPFFSRTLFLEISFRNGPISHKQALLLPAFIELGNANVLFFISYIFITTIL